MQEFFEYLERKNLSQEDFTKTVADWGSKELQGFATEVKEVVPYYSEPNQSNFGFIANAPLSGGHTPCAHVDCRLEHVDRLARFAALYGDQVLLQDPLDYFNSIISGAPHSYIDAVRSDLIDSLYLLYNLRPLLEVGLVGIARKHTAFCETHMPSIIKEGTLRRAEDTLHKILSRELDISMAKEDAWIRISGAENLLEHPVGFRTNEKVSVSQRPRRDGRFRIIGKTRKEIVKDLAGWILVDLIQQDIYCSKGDLNYLTDRELDLSVLEATNDPAKKRFSKALIEGFSHSLPFIQNVSLNKLLRLRMEEGESFQVYRDSVSAMLKSLKPADSEKIKEAFEDVVVPELRKIDLTIKNTKKLLRESITSNIIYGTSLVTVGLAGGFLSPDAGKILATLGGFQFGMNALRSLHQLMKEPGSIRDNKFYFLWKARRLADE
ncbi:MAG: hypothetical protein M3362_19160 [Acidobacteriota bacterium]|nr:hypothetical protein [Acidobacteriota bacterium]